MILQVIFYGVLRVILKKAAGIATHKEISSTTEMIIVEGESHLAPHSDLDYGRCVHKVQCPLYGNQLKGFSQVNGAVEDESNKLRGSAHHSFFWHGRGGHQKMSQS